MGDNKAWWTGDISDPKNFRHDAVCPNCTGAGLTLFYGVSGIPVNSCLMMNSEAEARAIPSGDLALGFCDKCGFITNTKYSSATQEYNTVYEDQQSFSPTFNAFAEGLAQGLIDKYDLRNKQLVEIGCSKGDFLIMMCRMGDNSGIGIDPSSIPGRVTAEGAERVEFIQDYYSEKYSDQVGDMIICRHTLEHIDKTLKFVQTVRNSIVDRDDTIVFFEVPDVVRVLKDRAFWDIYYEHCTYFSLGSLARLFKSCNFEVLDLAAEYDDQYLLIETRPVQEQPEKIHPNEESVDSLKQLVDEFARDCGRQLKEWNEYLTEARDAGKKVVAWGSGSKFVAFYTTLGLTDEIQHVVDINPHRQNRFIVGACMEVKSPEFLRDYQPDVVIIMNAIYTEEIRADLSKMGLDPEIRGI